MSCSHVDVRVAEKILRLRIELVRLRRENKALRCFCKLENGQKMEFCGVDIDEAMHRVLELFWQIDHLKALGNFCAATRLKALFSGRTGSRNAKLSGRTLALNGR